MLLSYSEYEHGKHGVRAGPHWSRYAFTVCLSNSPRSLPAPLVTRRIPQTGRISHGGRKFQNNSSRNLHVRCSLPFHFVSLNEALI